MKFNVGDRVKLMGNDCCGVDGAIAEIIACNGYQGSARNPIREEYRVKNICCGETSTWWNDGDMRLVSNNPNTMSVGSYVKKKFLPKNIQQQIKAGLRDDCGRLTEDGKDYVLHLMADQSDTDTALTAEALDIIEEQKEAKKCN